VHGPWSRSSSSHRHLKPEPLAGVALHLGAGTGPTKGDAAPVYIFTAPSPSRTACIHLPRALQHRLAGMPRSGAAAPGRRRCGSHGPRRPASSAPGHSTLLVTTSSPPCPEREVSTEAFTLLWTRPSSRGWTEPYALAVCLLTAVPHRAAAQTRRRLRAGHRAEPVVCRCRCLPQRARSLLGIMLILSRRAHAEFRLAIGTHTLSTPPSSEDPAFLWPGVV
jgi:hypothetical protein